jgi:small-conductance mechanosensitive channel
MHDEQYRLGVTVGVTYGSDMKLVKEVLFETASSMPWRLPSPEPRVLLVEFGSSSVDFSVFLTVSDPWKQRLYMAELREAIWFAFKHAGITIAFPQLDVHFDPSVEQSLSLLTEPAAAR